MGMDEHVHKEDLHTESHLELDANLSLMKNLHSVACSHNNVLKKGALTIEDQ